MSDLLPAALLPSSLLGGRSAGGAVVGDQLHIKLGSPGRCPTRPTLTTWIFDNSGSVLGGNDATGRRFDEAALTIAPVAKRCRCGRELLQVLHMDVPTSSDLPPTPVVRGNVDRITSSLRIPPDGNGASTLRATLARARRVVDGYPDHDAVLVVASDFELFDADTATLWAELASFPARVHAVALRSEPPTALSRDDRVTVTTIAGGVAPGAVAHSLFDALTVYRPGRQLAGQAE